MKVKKKGLPLKVAFKETFKFLLKNKVKIILILILMGYFLSCVQLSLTYISIYGNTSSIENDTELLRVDNIREDNSILLQNGDVLEDDDIDSYAKVFKNSGTWYSSDYKCLISEVTVSDIIESSRLPFIYFILEIISVIVGFIKKWIYKTTLGKVYLSVVIILSVVMFGIISLLLG